MRPESSAVVRQLLAAGLAGALLLGCSGDDEKNNKVDKADPKRPSGIITTPQARQVPIDIAKAEFDSLIGQPAVRVKEQPAPRRSVKLDRLRPETRKRLRRKYPNKRELTFPAETFTCQLYRGEQPKQFGWQFCFGEDGRLEYVSTTAPL